MSTKSKWKTPWNADEFPKSREINTQPSKTIPDQTMSIREIMDRYARGLLLEAGKVPIYEGEDDAMPDLSKLDLSEKHELLKASRQHTQSVKQYLQNQSKKEKQTPSPAIKAEES